jgi:Spy/CpxP family protein refolding chaperone
MQHRDPDEDGHGHGHSLSFLHGVVLTEAQQDRVFAIMHAAEPQRRELAKSVRKAHEALSALAGSGKFDDGKAAALAQSAGQAMAAMVLARARLEAQVMALLTPEQRQQATARGQHRGHPGDDDQRGMPRLQR